MKLRSILGIVLSFAMLMMIGCGGGGGGGAAGGGAQLTITATAGAGGTISPSGAVAVVSGASQTFTISPNAGFGVSNVSVDGVSQGAITTFPFTNVTANHTITALFIANPTTAVVTVATQGALPAGTLIGSIQVTLNYATTTGLSIAANNVVASGAGAGSTLFPNTNTAGQVVMGLINATGIQTGQFATATFSIAAGNIPTAADFSIAAGATVTDLNGVAIPGISVVIGTVVIQ